MKVTRPISLFVFSLCTTGLVVALGLEVYSGKFFDAAITATLLILGLVCAFTEPCPMIIKGKSK